MIWQSYENQGIALLDEPMAEELSSYLEKKESQLCSKLNDVVHLLPGAPPVLEMASYTISRLNNAVEEFGKKINSLADSQRQIEGGENWKQTSEKVNQALWSYVEVLEGCVTELFQQIDQINFEQWNVDLSVVVTTIKDELMHRMDDLVWAIRRLEEQLKNYRAQMDKRQPAKRKWLGSISVGILDPALEKTVQNCQKFLDINYQRFTRDYKAYLQLYATAEKSLHKLYGFRVLSALDIDLQDKFKQLYMLLKLWELNHKNKIFTDQDAARAVRGLAPPEVVYTLFGDYVKALRTAIFDKSRMVKKEFRLVFSDKITRRPVIENLLSYELELGFLRETMGAYENFLRHTEPAHMAQKSMFKWFKKQPVPKWTFPLQKLLREIEFLQSLCYSFRSSLEGEHALEQKLTAQAKHEIEGYLHEMGQPLASRELIKRNGKAVLTGLQKLDELASFYPEAVEFTSFALRKAMCADWKYHTLFETTLLHQIYEIHHHIVTAGEERQHLNRLNKFQRILEQLERWIKQNELLPHMHDINLDINDLKVYLQDFLAYAQRLEQKGEEGRSLVNKDAVMQASQALIEYLYLFGKFFHALRPTEAEQDLRKRLLFVDQYFEAIETKIQEYQELIH